MLSAAEIASMTATVTGALDTTVTVQRKTTTQDTYGHTSGTYATVSTAQINATKPSASQLQAYADIIGAKVAYIIRYMPTSDIREGDQIVYIGKNWLVQNILTADSYTFANDALMTEVQ
jgi:hypothetical protein